MTVLDVSATSGIDVVRHSDDVRDVLDRLAETDSGPEALPMDVADDQLPQLAKASGASERALRAAQGIVTRHVGSRGVGRAGRLHLRLTGPRPIVIDGPGTMVNADGDALSVGVALAVDPLVVVIVGAGGERAVHWRLMPGGPSTTARADGLRLLRSIAGGGQMVLRLGQQPELPPVDLPGGSWDFEVEWRLFEDLATLEEWSGVALPVPERVSAEDATRAAQAASWARTREIPATITGPVTFEVARALGDVDEVRVLQDFGVNLLGTEVPLGTGATRLAVRRLEGDGRTYRMWPVRTDVTFFLAAPNGRRLPPHRTQPDVVHAPEAQAAAMAAADLARPATRDLRGALAARGPRRPAGNGTAALLDELRGTS